MKCECAKLLKPPFFCPHEKTTNKQEEEELREQQRELERERARERAREELEREARKAKAGHTTAVFSVCGPPTSKNICEMTRGSKF